jgi:polysaccharide deacetylase family protein (PEP-CTERM system associated)
LRANVLTVDVEDWYQTNDFDFDIKYYNHYEDRIKNSNGKILELLAKYDVKATFFVLGCVAQKHPGIVKSILNGGHEIGSHGQWHQMVCRQTREEFRYSIVTSKQILEDITGREIRYYRAPSWSISLDSLWALEILEEEGFTCDSSIQPFRTPLSGIRGAPVTPYYPVIKGRELKILEVPPTVLKLGKIFFPFAGGFYLRVLPFSLVSGALKQVNRERPGIIYIHPWETDFEQPRLKVPFHIKIIHYYNLKNYLCKVEKLLLRFKFIPLSNLIYNQCHPALPVYKNLRG